MLFTLRVVTNDPTGQSSLAADPIELHDVPGLDGSAALQTGSLSAQGAALYRFPAGFANDFHNSSALTTMFVLAGELEVETSDGDRLVLGPGDAARFEDKDGPGHRSRVLKDDVLVLAIEAAETDGVGGSARSSG